MMEIYVTGRQMGKTERMLNWLREAEEDEARVLVLMNMHERDRVYFQTLTDDWKTKPEFETWQFISLSEALDRSRGFMSGVRASGRRVVFGVDNLDLMLRQIFGNDVGAITMTGVVSNIDPDHHWHAEAGLPRPFHHAHPGGRNKHSAREH